MVEYGEAGTRYAIKLSVLHDYLYTCAFSRYHIIDVTMSTIDMSQNETLLVIQQRGPDGECPLLIRFGFFLQKNYRRL